VGAKKTDISQIRKYLNGELDAHAMHQLEREAQDDPFLMDAIDGYQQAPGLQQRQLNNLDARLQQRINQSKTRKIIAWKYYAAAASVLLFFTLGYLLWSGEKQLPESKKVADNIIAPAPADHTESKPDAAIAPATVKQNAMAANVAQYNKRSVVSPKDISPPATDKTTQDLLKKLPGISVDANGNLVSKAGTQITKTRLNGKEYAGGDVAQAQKNLPADVVEKIQVVDDYGDQAARTASVGVNPLKDSARLKEVTITAYGSKKKQEVTSAVAAVSAPQVLKGKVDGVQVTTPDHRINGLILDQLGYPIPGVNIKVDGATTGAVTDTHGRFSLPANGQATLNISFVGYESQKVKAKEDDTVQVKLKESSRSLAEVVVTGYGQAKPVKPIKEAHPKMGWDNYTNYLKREAVADDDKATTVRLSFIVDEKGDISDIKILDGASESINKQAIDLVKDGPAWAPNVNGKPETVKLKIRFSKE
jgi:hypothetical protein